MNIPPVQLRPIMARGLRRNVEDAHSEGLALLYNKKPSKRGLVKIDAPSNPVTGATNTLAFPYPFLWKGATKNIYFNYIAAAHNLYEMTVGSWAAGTSKITTNTLNNVTGSGTLTIASADEWNHVENNDIHFITSGARYLTNLPIHGEWRVGSTADSAVPKAFCFDDNRLIMANFTTPAGYYTSSTGKRLWDVFSRQAPNSSFMKLGNVPGANFVMWGMPAGGDPDSPYTLEQTFLSFIEIDEYEQILLDALRDWQMGFCFLPWEGETYHMQKLGDVIMLYGSEAIGYLAPLQGGGYIPRFLLGVGIASLGAACGNEQEHIFLDKEGYLWRVSAGLKLEQLRYNEFLANFTTAHPVISYDGSTGDYYISKADKGYILTPDDRTAEGGPAGGLAETRYALSSLISYNNNIYGPAYAGAAGYNFKTGEINLDSRKVKTCETIEIGKATPTDSTCTLEMKAKTGAYKTSTKSGAFSEGGIVDFVDSGIDFQVTVASTSDNTEAIQYGNINFRDTTEKRGLAGYVA